MRFQTRAKSRCSELGDEIEIIEEEDGDVIVDFEPGADSMGAMEFGDNLAESLSDRELARISGDLVGEYEANKSSRQEWEDTYSNGLELLGFSYEERTQPYRNSESHTPTVEHSPSPTCSTTPA